MSRRLAALMLIAAPTALAGCHTDSRPRHVDANAFAWSGTVAPGQWVHVRNTTGRINVLAWDSSTVEVRASEHWRGNRAADSVHFVQRATDDGVIICTMVGQQDSCTPEHYGSDSGVRVVNPFDFLRHGGKASVDYVVHVPAGVKVDVSTVLGEVGVADVTGEVKAQSVSGSVRVAARGGPVTASSVNGSVRVAIDSLTAPGDIDLATVNGSVTAQLPAALTANVSLETAHGRVTSDYAVAGVDTTTHNEMHGTIGGGGRTVKLETVNGSVRLLKGS
jgi:hypothetical protein